MSGQRFLSFFPQSFLSLVVPSSLLTVLLRSSSSIDCGMTASKIHSTSCARQKKNVQKEDTTIPRDGHKEHHSFRTQVTSSFHGVREFCSSLFCSPLLLSTSSLLRFFSIIYVLVAWKLLLRLSIIMMIMMMMTAKRGSGQWRVKKRLRTRIITGFSSDCLPSVALFRPSLLLCPPSSSSLAPLLPFVYSQRHVVTGAG